jgi:hypothetical protein
MMFWSIPKLYSQNNFCPDPTIWDVSQSPDWLAWSSGQLHNNIISLDLNLSTQTGTGGYAMT